MTEHTNALRVQAAEIIRQLWEAGETDQLKLLAQQALVSVDRLEERKEGEEPSGESIHEFFELSYAQYLTIPRSVLQSMPLQWQASFVSCLQLLDVMIDWRPQANEQYRCDLWMIEPDEQGEDYWVTPVEDPLGDYERGRRRIPHRSEEE